MFVLFEPEMDEGYCETRSPILPWLSYPVVLRLSECLCGGDPAFTALG